MTDNTALRRVIMSKSVAQEYLDEVSRTAQCLTVYFSTETDYERMTDRISHIAGERVSHCRGFDHVTFLSSDEAVISGLMRRAGELDLEIDLI